MVIRNDFNIPKTSCVILLTISLGILAGCSAEDETVPEEADIPKIVRQEAEAWTVEEYEYYKKVDADNNYSDWRIESLAHCYTYENFEGMVLQVYQMNIEFLSDTPESVVLIGGMTMTDDDWVVPNYANSRYLVFRQDGETLTLLKRMFENDCYAGDDTFTGDLKRWWEEAQQSENTLSLH